MLHLSERRTSILLKREYDRLLNLHERMSNFKCKSRKGWAKHITNTIETTSIIIQTEAYKKEVQLLSLIPDASSKRLKVCLSVINVKKCTVKTVDPRINFSTHFYWRAMQSYKTENLTDIKHLLKIITLIIMDIDNNYRERKEYMDDMVLTINSVGIVVVAIDICDDELFYTVKTFMSKDQIEGKHLSNYKRICSKGVYYEVAPGNKQKLNME